MVLNQEIFFLGWTINSLANEPSMGRELYPDVPTCGGRCLLGPVLGRADDSTPPQSLQVSISMIPLVLNVPKSKTGLQLKVFLSYL